MNSPDKSLKALTAVTTATLTTILLKKGLRNVWIRGAFPLAPGTNRVMRLTVSPDLTKVSNRTDIVTDIAYKPKPSNHPTGEPTRRHEEVAG